MIWWHSMLLVLALLDPETIRAGGFYILFFGLSVLTVITLIGLGLMEVVRLPWLLFSGITVGFLLVFRGPLLAKLKQDAPTITDIDTMVEEFAIPLEPLAVGEIGKVELRGTTWTAKNVGTTPLSKDSVEK